MSPPVADSTKDVEKKSTRRINKPLIEKRRRARINDCLAQLKSIVLEADESKNGRSSKLEKADILEMTVEFLKKRSSRPQVDVITPVKSNGNQPNYMDGYSKCIAEISSFLEQMRFINTSLKKDIVDHIAAKLKNSHSQVECDKDDEKMEKGQITPLRNYSGQKTNEHEAIDLRLNNHISSDNTSKTTVCETSNRTFTLPKMEQISSQNQVINQPMPVGLLCGGQMVLLVQLPSSITPQNVPPLSSLPETEPHTLVPSLPVLPQEHVTLSTSHVGPGLIQGSDTVTSQFATGSVVLPQLNTAQAYPNANNCGTSGILAGFQILNEAPSSAIKNPPNQSDHWRPW